MSGSCEEMYNKAVFDFDLPAAGHANVLRTPIYLFLHTVYSLAHPLPGVGSLKHKYFDYIFECSNMSIPIDAMVQID
jgi:hypothetical protein